MNLTPELKKILEAGMQAPSGENCQPWQFNVKNGIIEIYNVPDRDRSLYNWGQRASYIANGAAIENILISLAHFGYESEIQYFPKLENPNFVANIIFSKQKNNINIADDLYPFIFSRVTNRKPYHKNKIAFSKLEALEAGHADYYKTRVAFVEDRSAIKTLAKVGAANEYIMMSNHFLHDFFFDHVSWTKEEDERKKIGFYIETLELPPPAKAAFKLIRRWSVAKHLVKLNFPAIVAKQNSSIYESSGAVGAVMIKENTPYDFLMAGRTMQNLWLKATSFGLYVQPMTGILFFKLKITSPELHQFSDGQIKMINDCYEKVKIEFNAGQEIIAMMFRIGNASAPTAHSRRFELNDVVKIIE